MNAVITKVLGDLRRRRLQAAVIAFVIFLASGTTTLGLTLLQTSSHPWERAFEAQRGAHLTVLFDRHKVDPEQLARTPGLIGASQVGGPWPWVETSYELGAHMAIGGGGFKFPLITVGRESPQADVELLRLVAGRWVRGPGEIVITRSFADLNHIRLGDRMRSLGTLERRALVVVGEASDVDEADSEFGTQFAWVTESQLPLLAPDWGYKMAYRFPYAPSEQELRAKLARLQMALPAGAVLASMNYLLLQKVFNGGNQIALTFFLAFGIFALLACAATIANLVSGIVIASYREIGVMKAVGFTPLQVVGTLVVQMQLPTLAGCLFGVPAGVALSVPLVDRETASLALPPEPPFAPVMALATLLAVMTVVLLATVVPGLRAGRLSAVGAISMATAPSGGRRSWLGSMLRRLPLPRPLALGAGDAFARPLRAGLTALAVLVGVATLVFATGLPASARTLVDIAFAHRSTDVILQRVNQFFGWQAVGSGRSDHCECLPRRLGPARDPRHPRPLVQRPRRGSRHPRRSGGYAPRGRRLNRGLDQRTASASTARGRGLQREQHRGLAEAYGARPRDGDGPLDVGGSRARGAAKLLLRDDQAGQRRQCIHPPHPGHRARLPGRHREP